MATGKKNSSEQFMFTSVKSNQAFIWNDFKTPSGPQFQFAINALEGDPGLAYDIKYGDPYQPKEPIKFFVTSEFLPQRMSHKDKEGHWHVDENRTTHLQNRFDLFGEMKTRKGEHLHFEPNASDYCRFLLEGFDADLVEGSLNFPQTVRPPFPMFNAPHPIPGEVSVEFPPTVPPYDPMECDDPLVEEANFKESQCHIERIWGERLHQSQCTIERVWAERLQLTLQRRQDAFNKRKSRRYKGVRVLDVDRNAVYAGRSAPFCSPSTGVLDGGFNNGTPSY
jgi:hypothetical protein